MSKSIMEKLGLKKVSKLNKTICMKRRVYLRKQIEAGKYKGVLLKYARYYASWYGWLANQGGTRARQRW